MPYNCIVVLGPTASGKTRLACRIAASLNGAVISADSRQVYKGLNIGTGKDLDEYTVNGIQIPYYLIDVIDAGEQFYLHQFIEALKNAFDEIRSQTKLPVICGGTGLYLDTLRKDFSFTQVPENVPLRKELEVLPKEALLQKLGAFPTELIRTVDTSSKKRIVRGIEIALHRLSQPIFNQDPLPYKPYYIGIQPDAETRKELISQRLLKRLDEGLIEEAEALLKVGITHERLELFGLEYKFISLYLTKILSKEKMVSLLQTAIFQFAKRQMTWFRKMEKEGVKIHWVDQENDVESVLKDLIGQFNE